jgi:hypothetical protein
MIQCKYWRVFHNYKSSDITVLAATFGAVCEFWVLNKNFNTANIQNTHPHTKFLSHKNVKICVVWRSVDETREKKIKQNLEKCILVYANARSIFTELCGI